MVEHDYTRDQVVGCLLAGAVGDALGGGVELRSWDSIEAEFGPEGIGEFTTAHGRLGAITDDTQMTLFTAEGLIRAAVRRRERGIAHLPTVVHHAYLRWLATQSQAGAGGSSSPYLDRLDGWLVEVPELWHRRGPGRTCLSALSTGRMGSSDGPLNDSKGCGGVMRAAPAGLLSARSRFELGCEFAAITHGHPDGFYPAGALAVIVGALFDGADLGTALDRAEGELREPPRAAATLAALRAGRSAGAAGVPTPSTLESLGGGWVGEEALAIAVACAVGGYDRPGAALRAAVNHSGDSDSTGAVCGNILGAAHGTRWLPPSWLGGLELRDVITRIAEDCHRACRIGVPHDPDGTVAAGFAARYPGW